MSSLRFISSSFSQLTFVFIRFSSSLHFSECSTCCSRPVFNVFSCSSFQHPLGACRGFLILPIFSLVRLMSRFSDTADFLSSCSSLDFFRFTVRLTVCFTFEFILAGLFFSLPLFLSPRTTTCRSSSCRLLYFVRLFIPAAWDSSTFRSSSLVSLSLFFSGCLPFCFWVLLFAVAGQFACGAFQRRGLLRGADPHARRIRIMSDGNDFQCDVQVRFLVNELGCDLPVLPVLLRFSSFRFFRRFFLSFSSSCSFHHVYSKSAVLRSFRPVQSQRALMRRSNFLSFSFLSVRLQFSIRLDLRSISFPLVDFQFPSLHFFDFPFLTLLVVEARRFDCRVFPVFFFFDFQTFVSGFQDAVRLSFRVSDSIFQPQSRGSRIEFSIPGQSLSIRCVDRHPLGVRCGHVFIEIVTGTLLFLLRVRWRRHDLHSMVLACVLTFLRFFFFFFFFFQFSGGSMFRLSGSFHFPVFDLRSVFRIPS